MLTIAPPPCSRIRGAAALEHRNGPVRFTAMIRLQSASLVSSTGANTATPALLTRASSRPNRSITAAIAAATAAASETSQVIASVLFGSFSAATALACSSPSMSSSATRHPSARKRLAVASPIPRAAPVTSATLAAEEVMTRSIALVVRQVPRKGSQWRAHVSEAVYVGLSLLGKLKRRRDMADKDTGCHCCLEVLRLARSQLERNHIFDLGCRRNG